LCVYMTTTLVLVISISECSFPFAYTHTPSSIIAQTIFVRRYRLAFEHVIAYFNMSNKYSNFLQCQRIFSTMCEIVLCHVYMSVFLKEGAHSPRKNWNQLYGVSRNVFRNYFCQTPQQNGMDIINECR